MTTHDRDDDVRGALAALLRDEPPMRSGVPDDVRRGRALRLRQQRWLVGGAAAVTAMAVVGVVAFAGQRPDDVRPAPVATDGQPTPTPTPTPTATGPAADPTQLVGWWTVHGTSGSDGATLQLGAMGSVSAVTLYGACGALDGNWVASPAGGFVAALYGGEGSCVNLGPAGWAGLTPDWLADSRGYRLTADGAALVGADGAVMARLTPGTRPSTPPSRADITTALPTVTPAIRASYAALVPPDGVRSSPSGALVGRWVPTGVTTRWEPTGRPVDSRAFLVLRADGTYQASDGCNEMAGRWALDPAGVPLVSSGLSTLVACDDADPVRWLIQARAAVVDAGTLVLHDGAGDVLGRLRLTPAG